MFTLSRKQLLWSNHITSLQKHDGTIKEGEIEFYYDYIYGKSNYHVHRALVDISLNFARELEKELIKRYPVYFESQKFGL